MSENRGKLSRAAVLAGIGCFLCELAAVGIGAGTNSLYTAPVCGELGISRTAYSVSITVMYLMNMAVYCLFPLILKKIPLRGVFCLGLVCETAAFLTYSQARSLQVLYLAAALLGAGLVFLGAVPITAVVNYWFPGREGTMLGVVLAGSGIGGAVLIPVIGGLMEAFGWRVAFLISAGVMAVIAVPCLLFIKSGPSRKAPGREAGRKEGTFAIVRRPGMAMTMGYAFLVGFSIQPTYLSIAAHLAERQIGTQAAAQVLSMICLVSLAGKVALGNISDRWGPVPVLAASHIAFLGAALSLVFFTDYLILPEVFFGIGSTPLTLVLPILCTHMFRERSDAALSLCMASQTAGIALGVLLVGFLFDRMGSYDGAFLLLGAVNLTAFFLMVFTYQKQNKRSVLQ